MRRNSLDRRSGFTLLELVMVIAIMLAVAAYAIPTFLSAVSDYRLKNTMSQVAGLLQQQRMTSVRLNTTYWLQSTTSNGRTIAWFEPSSGNGQWDSGEPMIEFPSNVTLPSSGFPGTTALYTAASINPETPGTTVQFNARGLPCIGSPCSNYDTTNSKSVGFVIYFQGTSNYGRNMWGAVTITPAGRVRTWFWNGSAYSAQ